MTRADEYQRAAKNLSDFLVAFHQLIDDLEPTGALGRFPRWEPKPGRRSDAERHAGEVQKLAGPAAEAFELSGQWINYKPPGTWQTQPINPALAWTTMFDEMPMVDPALVVTVGQQALSLLQHRRSEQASRQRGLIGALAWFFTLAPRVRQAAGLPARSVPGQAVTWITILVQGIIVTAVGGVLVYPLAEWLGWL